MGEIVPKIKRVNQISTIFYKTKNAKISTPRKNFFVFFPHLSNSCFFKKVICITYAVSYILQREVFGMKHDRDSLLVFSNLKFVVSAIILHNLSRNLFCYTDRLACLRFTPQDGAIRLETKTCSFLKTERISMVAESCFSINGLYL
jgi:hypothetical protein